MQMAVEKGRTTRPGTSSSASAASTAATRRASSSAIIIGLNYVSCSPFRVPIARLAAARAALFNPLKAGTKKAAKPKAPVQAKKPARKR